MYAIVDIVGQQFKVEQGKKIFVHRLQAEEGATVNFDKVLLTEHEGKVNVGTPYLSGALIKATVLEHVKGDKVIVFKKKRRKGYQKKNGHRQCMTQIHIDEVV
ncbi:MAG: 50S ribosomal protein L21 [Prevotellaceae bacterium]|jgi:large subunit ribosomal protein L21|nr:50S ribosomal protein L21 [Prevotellaceae bacterium]